MVRLRLGGYTTIGQWQTRQCTGIIANVTRGEKSTGFLKVRVQSIDSGLYLNRSGQWTTRDAIEDPAMLCMDPVEGLRLCLRLGIKNVRFTLDDLDPANSIYPFGGDPAQKAYRKQIRKQLAEERRIRSEHRALEAKIRALEATQRRTA